MGGWGCRERPVVMRRYHWEREHYALREAGPHPDHGRRHWAGTAGPAAPTAGWVCYSAALPMGHQVHGLVELPQWEAMCHDGQCIDA
jgi:hypothetical protein